MLQSLRQGEHPLRPSHRGAVSVAAFDTLLAAIQHKYLQTTS